MSKRIRIGTDEWGFPDYFEEAAEGVTRGVVVDVPDELWANWLSAEQSYNKLREQIIALHEWPNPEPPKPPTPEQIAERERLAKMSKAEIAEEIIRLNAQYKREYDEAVALNDGKNYGLQFAISHDPEVLEILREHERKGLEEAGRRWTQQREERILASLLDLRDEPTDDAHDPLSASFADAMVEARSIPPYGVSRDRLREIERTATVEISGVAKVGTPEIAKSMPPGAKLPLKDSSGVEIGYACEFREQYGSTVCDVYIHPGATINSLAELLRPMFENNVYPASLVGEQPADSKG